VNQQDEESETATHFFLLLFIAFFFLLFLPAMEIEINLADEWKRIRGQKIYVNY
jgi:hypothetical protein